MKDIAGREYWDRKWHSAKLPRPLDLHSPALRHYIDQKIHRELTRILTQSGATNGKLLELGCGGSVWLPYFHQSHGFDVCGIDYSAIGCDISEAVLRDHGVDGDIVCGDFLDVPPSLESKFDVVVSFGLMEHYAPVNDALRAAARFLRPSGLLITLVPNLVGWNGFVQKMINRTVYDKHCVVSVEDLHEFHHSAGLVDVHAYYFGSLNFGICNLDGINPGSFEWWGKKIFLAALNRLAMGVWTIERLNHEFSSSRARAPYIFATGRRPPSESDSTPERNTSQ